MLKWNRILGHRSANYWKMKIPDDQKQNKVLKTDSIKIELVFKRWKSVKKQSHHRTIFKE